MSDMLESEIEQARRTLRLTDNDLRLLPEEEGRKIYHAAESQFVATPGRRWWWEDLRQTAITCHFDEDNGWEYLSALVPSPEERVWFIAGDDPRAVLVYESTPGVIQKIVGECYYFEYIIVARNFRWLLGENHHGLMFAIGEGVAINLMKMLDRKD